jgi:hypothetical protein
MTDAPMLNPSLDEADVVPRPALEALGEHTSARELAEAIGRPALAKRVDELCGPHVSTVLAEAVSAAVERRTRAMEAEVARQLEMAHAAIRARWQPVADESAPDNPLGVWAARVEI